jgi:hypothetical protein
VTVGVRGFWPGSLASIAAIAMSVSCGGKAAPPPASGPLGGAVAHVGSAVITPDEVRAVANARDVPPRQALDDLVADALAAQGAEASGLTTDRSVAWEQTAALARQVPARIGRDAVAQGPATDDELANVTVVHAVVLRAPTLRDRDALLLAQAIADAVHGAHDAGEFIARAGAVAHPHAKVVAESLGPFRADGLLSSGAVLDGTFVAAAFALHTPHEFSPVVVSPFGWHVLQLIERTPPAGAQAASLREELGPVVTDLRARQALDALLLSLHGSVHVETAVAADELMARVGAPP